MYVMAEMAFCIQSQIKTHLVRGEQDFEAQIKLRIAAPRRQRVERFLNCLRDLWRADRSHGNGGVEAKFKRHFFFPFVPVL